MKIHNNKKWLSPFYCSSNSSLTGFDQPRITPMSDFAGLVPVKVQVAVASNASGAASRGITGGWNHHLLHTVCPGVISLNEQLSTHKKMGLVVPFTSNERVVVPAERFTLLFFIK